MNTKDFIRLGVLVAQATRREYSDYKSCGLLFEGTKALATAQAPVQSGQRRRLQRNQRKADILGVGIGVPGHHCLNACREPASPTPGRWQKQIGAAAWPPIGAWLDWFHPEHTSGSVLVCRGTVRRKNP